MNESGSYMLTSVMLKANVICDVEMTTPNILNDRETRPPIQPMY